VAHRTTIVAIGQMRGKVGGALQFASCLNAPSLPARNDRIVTVSNLLFAIYGNGDAPEGEKKAYSYVSVHLPAFRFDKTN